MKNLLFVSIAFPPKNDPECIQTGKYFKYLAKSKNYNIDVVTSKSPTLFMPEDVSLGDYSNGIRQLFEIRIFENKYLNFIIRKLFPNTLNIPDSKFTFNFGFKKIVNKLKEKPNVVYSRSFPMSSTYLASRLANFYNIPWIMHLSDPWLDNPLHNYTIKTKRKLELKERAYFEQAKIITVTSSLTKNIYVNKYPEFKNKIKFLPNVFDPDDIDLNQKIDNSKLRFVYTGGLSSKRSAKLLLDVINEINDTDKSLLKNVEFIFAGQFDRKNKAMINDIKLKNIINKGLVSYNSSIKIQKSAHVLLIIEAKLNSDKEAVFFPSKLLDYFILKRHIIAITHNKSQIRKVLQKTNSKCFEHNEFKSLYNHILYLINNYNAKDYSIFKGDTLINMDYSAELNAHKLSVIIDSIV